ncbi:MAG: PAS domain S-box protein, partial [candidate division NC10 bacterium]|nr:PAS domain S-box protein [candidate division NC10 bacterium]
MGADGGVGYAELRSKVGWFIGLRLLVATIFLVTTILLQLRKLPPFPVVPFYILVGLAFTLSLIYAILLKRLRNLYHLVHIQLTLDLLLASALLHYTGGVDSAFSFIYLFIVFAAGTLLSRKGSLLFASATSILYGVLMNLEFYTLIPPVGSTDLGMGRSTGHVLFQLSMNITAFFLIALLSSSLTERLREAGRQLEERGIDLRNLQTLHEDIIANIPSGIMTLDFQGRIASFNEAAEQITGFAFEELRDKRWDSTPFAAFPGFGNFFAAPNPSFFVSGEMWFRRKDGQTILVGLSLSPFRDSEGKVLGLVVIFQDMTERRKVEERLRQTDRLAAVGQLAAGIAHEIRNPLAAISGAIQLLKEEGDSLSRNRKLLDIVLREAERLKLITGQFLDFTRPNAAPLRTCDLHQVLEETLTLLERASDRHPETKIVYTDLRSQTRDLKPLMVLADPDQLKQIFWNICLNALQAMPNGGTLTVRGQGAGG